MKVLSAASLDAQKNSKQEIIESIILYKLFQLVITEISDTDTLIISGDLSTDLAQGDTILFPLVDFVNEYTITSMSYDSGANETTINISDTILTTDYLNSYIALKIIITDRLIKHGVKDLVSKIEGVELNDFDSGKIDIEMDNNDGYFSNKNSDGLFDGNDVFFLKYNLKYKIPNESDVIYFGGIVSLVDSQPDYYNKTFIIRAHGHSKELERYPAFTVIDIVSKDLPSIAGCEIVNYTESSTSQAGVKEVQYDPFTTSDMNGITIVGVSRDTSPGIKKLEYRYPNEFRWDNGTWTQILDTSLDADGNKKIYARGGSGDNLYIILNFGRQGELNIFPDLDTEIWLYIEQHVVYAGDRVVSKYGKPIIKFDNGNEEIIKIHFQRIIIYDDSATTYTDITDTINDGFKNEVTTDILEDVDDEIIIVASERFWGIEFLFATPGSDVNEYTFHYSVGGTVFSSTMDLGTNGLVDGTVGLTQDGTVKWNIADGWLVNNIGITDDLSYKGYMIKIKKTVHDDVPVAKEIKRVLRLIGQNGDFLELKFYQELMLPESKTDTVILYKDNLDVWHIGTWYQNITVKELLEITLQQASYLPANRAIEDLKIIKDIRYFNIWGKPPKRNYGKNPNCIFVDGDNEYVYAGIGNEIWRCSFTGRWQLVTAINYVIPNKTNPQIIRIWQVSDDVYVLVDYVDYKPGIIPEEEVQAHSAFKFFKYNLTSGTLTDTYPLLPNAYDGKKIIINGFNVDGTGGSYYNVIGGGWGNPGGGSSVLGNGENLCVPFRQIIQLNRTGDLAVYMAIADSVDDSLSGYAYFLFINGFNLSGKALDKNGSKYYADFGYYTFESEFHASPDFDPFHCAIDFNSQGCLIRYGNNAYCIRQSIDAQSNICHYLVNATTGSKLGLKYYLESHIPIAHCLDENNIIYLSYVSWLDDRLVATATPSEINYSYINKLILGDGNVQDFFRAEYWDGSTFTDKTTEANNGSSFGTIFVASGDIIYLCVAFSSSQKLRQVLWDTSDEGTNEYVFEYWDGSAWVDLPDVGIGHYDDDKIISWSLPDDWASNIIDGTEAYWMRIRMTSYNTTPTHNKIESKEVTMWDSQLWDSGNLKRFTPTWMIFNPDEGAHGTIHGCMFNRTHDDTFPFQWSYFVFEVDVGGGSMHISRTGDNFTFDPTYAINNHVYNGIDSKIYCMFESVRHKEKTAFLASVVFDSDTDTITITKEGEPISNEWGCKDLFCDTALGNIYGLSRDTRNIFWEYSTEFYQRIEVADFSGMTNIKDIVKELASITICMYMIHSERVIRFLKRGSYNDSINLIWNDNVMKINPDFVRWEHFYDAVRVEYKNLIDSDDSGDNKTGYDGWLKRILPIKSDLIQNVHMAKLLSEDMYDFYSNHRIHVKDLFTSSLIQLENVDKFNLFMPDKMISIDPDIDFIIIGIRKTTDFNFEIESLQRIAPPSDIVFSALGATDIDINSFTANWSLTGVTADSFKIDVSESSDFSSFVLEDEDAGDGSTFSLPVTGLESGATYYYRLRYVIDGVPSDNSNTISLITIFSDEALIYFNQFDTDPDLDVKQALATFIDGIVADGIYAKMDEMWLFAMNTQANALKGIKAYKECTITGSMTFTVDRGFANPTGSTSNYINTNYNPNDDAVNLNINSASLGIYSRTNNSDDDYDIGIFSVTLGFFTLRCRVVSDTFNARILGTNSFAVANTVSQGLFIAGRLSSTDVFLNKNGTNSTNTVAASTIPDLPILISRYAGTSTPSGATTREYSFAFVGAGLTPTECTSLFTRLEALLDYIGAGVV